MPILWLCPILVAIAIVAAWTTRAWAVLVAHLLITLLVVLNEVFWIQRQMAASDWNGQPNMDFTFFFAIFTLVGLINIVLVPISTFGVLRRTWHIVQSEQVIS